MDKQSQMIAEMDKQMAEIEKYEKLVKNRHISQAAYVTYIKKLIIAKDAYNKLAAAYINETK